jgi:preprotein translocase subunit SecG
METILLVIQMVIALALIGIVLIQRSDSDGMGLGGAGGGMGLLSGRAKANALTRTTAILAAAFMLNSLLFSIVTTSSRESILEKIEAQKEATTPDVPRADETAPAASDAASAAPAPAEATAPAEAPAPANDNQPLSVPRAE